MKDTLLMKNYRLIIIIAVLSAAIARVYAGPVREMPSETLDTVYVLSLIHISEPTRL